MESELPTIVERELEEVSYNENKEKVLNKVITIKGKMGSGSFSKVFKIDYKFTWDENGEKMEETLPYAMKVLDTELLSKKVNISAGGSKDQSYLDLALQELEIYKLIRHENIIKVFEIIHSDDKLYIVMELANLGSLLEWNGQVNKYEMTPKIREYFEERSLLLFGLASLDWENLEHKELVAKSVFKQLVAALTYLHEKDIVHRDLKWENVLAKHNAEEDKLEVKLIDFSVGVKLSSPDQKLTKFEGTLEYRAPEIVDEPYDPKKADVWGLGCCLYSFMWGHLPLTDKEDFEKRIEDAKISENMVELLKGMLNKNPAERFTTEDLSLSLWLL